MLEKLRSQSLLLDPTYKTQKLKENPRRHKKLSAKQKRAIKLYNIPEEQQRFVKDKGGGEGGGMYENLTCLLLFDSDMICIFHFTTCGRIT